MLIEVKVPALPESVVDATVLAWHTQIGEPLKRDAKLVDLETDKVVLEVAAPDQGVLKEVFKPEGDTVHAGEVLGIVDTDGSGAVTVGSGASGATAAQVRSAAPAATAVDAVASARETEQAAQPVQDRPQPGPAARRLLSEHHLDADRIPGTGPGGRVTKSDVLSFLERRPVEAPAPNLEPAAEMSAVPEAPAALLEEPPPFAPIEEAPTGQAVRPEQRVPMTRLRRRLAERLVAAQHQAAMLTTFNEVNMAAVTELRNRYRERFEKAHGARLGFMSFFVKAVVHALKRYPVVNASIDGADIVYHGYYDIGIAVSSPRGLVVPILRDADGLSLAEVETAIAALAGKARDATLSLEELTGGTFSITNGGVFGSLMSTPILNPPQSAILGMHKIQERPVAENGALVIRPMMYLALSYDHRLIDGSDAVRFLVAIKEGVEDPSRLLLEV